jgi:hypothetical protein
MRSQLKTTLMVFLTFCLLVSDLGGDWLKNPAHAAVRNNSLDFLTEFFELPSGTDKNIFFIEDQNAEHLESMRRILYALNFGDNLFLDPESGKESHFLINSGKLLYPDIEFIKINPTKYRLRIHRAQNSFPLLFNQIYHNKWRVYLKSWEPESGSIKEQKEKLEKTSSPFDIPTAIRNNKLPLGEIWETWFPGRLELVCPEDKDNKKNSEIDCFAEDPQFWNVGSSLNSQIVRWPEVFHWNMNGYANSWWLGLDLLKKLPAVQGQKAGFYNLHPDGSVDFEVVIEFWPQRLFYLGIIISGIMIIACAGFLVFRQIYFSLKRRTRDA